MLCVTVTYMKYCAKYNQLFEKCIYNSQHVINTIESDVSCSMCVNLVKKIYIE